MKVDTLLQKTNSNFSKDKKGDILKKATKASIVKISP